MKTEDEIRTELARLHDHIAASRIRTGMTVTVAKIEALSWVLGIAAPFEQEVAL